MSKGWLPTLDARLEPLDAERAEALRTELAERAAEEEMTRLEALLGKNAPPSRFVAAACDLSDFLRDALIRRPAILEEALDSSIEDRLAAILGAIAASVEAVDVSETGLMAALRQLKGEAHVLIALDDLAGAGAALTVERLTRLAEACVRAAVRFLLRDAHRQGKLALPDPTDPEQGSGWIVLGMGKLGGRELNFSSDIDLIVFVDTEAPAIADPLEASETFSRLTKRLVRILQDRTEHGYVFRTDLRLRPDPGSTPLAIPVEAALIYYEARGQNWERAAMIKARPIAGDIAAGEAVLRDLRPYVWRKYMDFAAIADVHSIKRQIHAHKGHGEIAVAGHNVKLGRGGIREIEFFVQTQQLIAGGRVPELRGRSTVPMLEELAARNWVTPEAAAALTREYWFLRDVEHAVQIVADEQTHTLPEEDAGLLRIARLRGFADADAFSAAFRKSLAVVERHYAALFETAPELSGDVGNLVFTGDIDDPDTLETLARLGFERPSDISRLIRTWHFGRYRATRSTEARERLTELTPALLAAFGETRRADEAILRFDAFLAGLPAGIQLFSLLGSNPGLLKLLATIMAAAPRLAEIITRRPHVFDGLLDPSLMAELPNRAYLGERLAALTGPEAGYEETLDRLRIFAAEQKFLIGIRLLTGAIDAVRAGKAFSDLADITIASAFAAVRAEFERLHGKVPGGEAVILGMGKLGSRELTAGSDVDLILLYDHEPDAAGSDGKRPLDATLYFARLTQRMIAAVSAPTAEGVLYELDLRLRPSGNKGPVATHVEAFAKYQREDAWTWEHMALTRARIVAGDPGLAERVEAVVAGTISHRRDAGKTARDAAEMRKVIATEKPARDIFDVKLIEGGLIDLEFVAQVAWLTGNVEGAATTSTADTLSRLADGLADADARTALVQAHRLYSALTQILRLCLTGAFDKDAAPPGLIDLVLSTTAMPSLDRLEAELVSTAKLVKAEAARILRAA